MGAKPNDCDLILPGGRVIPEARLTFKADAYGGPGGQHANRSATRIEVSVAVASLPLSAKELEMLRLRLANRISNDDRISVRVSSERSQRQNRVQAVKALSELISGAIKVERPRRNTKPTHGSRLRRTKSKTELSQKKASRSWRPDQ